MPFQDGTGPFGDGRPGRGLGPCGRFGIPVRGGLGRGCGNGRGRGMGFRARRFWNWFRTDQPAGNRDMYPYTKADLQAQKEDLEKQIQWLNEQITNYRES